eukprot:scaffold6751_cov188-Skeletonema_menzelii.AAC.4
MCEVPSPTLGTSLIEYQLSLLIWYSMCEVPSPTLGTSHIEYQLSQQLNSEKIFTKAKQMLREWKDDGVDGIDNKIDEACDNISSLLSSWGKVFSTLYNKDHPTQAPTQADLAQFKIDLDTAVGKHRALRGLVDYNNDTPKLHCIEDHAVEALTRHPDLLLMIEEWVEQFHQTEKKKVENRVRFIKDAFKRAESASKKRAAENDSDLKAQNRRTKKLRGTYKPRMNN